MIVRTADPRLYDPILFAPAQWRKKVAPASRPDPPQAADATTIAARAATASVPAETTRGTRIDLHA